MKALFYALCVAIPIAGAVSGLQACPQAKTACKGAQLANDACDMFMLARPNDAGVEPVSGPELSNFAEAHHKAKAMRVVADAGHE